MPPWPQVWLCGEDDWCSAPHAYALQRPQQCSLPALPLPLWPLPAEEHCLLLTLADKVMWQLQRL